MRRLLILMVAMATVLSVSAQESDERYVQVTGYAQREVVPDKFTVAIELKESDTRGRRGVEEQERAMVAALEKVGIDTRTALALSYSSSDYYRRGGSLLSRSYELTLLSTEALTAAFDALSPLGLHSVELVRAESSRLEEIRSELRREAIINAQRQASELATAIGQSIGPCLTIIDYTSGSAPIFRMNMAYKSIEESAVANAVVESFAPEFRAIKLEHSLSAKFALQP